MGTGDTYPCVKGLHREPNQSPSFSATFKNVWSSKAAPPYASTAFKVTNLPLPLVYIESVNLSINRKMQLYKSKRNISTMLIEVLNITVISEHNEIMSISRNVKTRRTGKKS